MPKITKPAVQQVEPLDPTRIKRLSGHLIEQELLRTKRELNSVNATIQQHRKNSNDVGAQMEHHARSNRLFERCQALEDEKARRIENGSWNSEDVGREVAKKDNTPVSPALRPAAPPATQELEGEELPIKVRDGAGIRAWRPSDGAIHGATAADTITDVSQTTTATQTMTKK